jgi:hypothetical protein
MVKMDISLVVVLERLVTMMVPLQVHMVTVD